MLFQILLTLVLPFVTNPESFGLLSILLTNVSFALIFTSLGIPSALTFFTAKDQDFKNIIRFVYKSTFFQLLFVILVECIARLFWGKFLLWPSSFFEMGILGVVYFCGLSLIEKMFAAYNGLHLATLFVRISSCFLFLQFIALIIYNYIAVVKHPSTPIYIIIAITLFQALYLYAYLLYVHRNVVKNVHHNAIDIQKWQYALPAYMANLIQFLASRSDIWMIDYFLTKSEVGFYAFATKLGQVILALPLMLASIIFPKLTAGNMTKVDFERLVRWCNGILLSLCILASIGAYIFIPLIWNDEYNRSIWPFILILPGYFAQAQIILYAAYFASKANLKLNMYNSLITLIGIVLFNLLLIHSLKLNGSAISLSLANSIGAFWIISKYNKEEQKYVWRLFPNKLDLAYFNHNERQHGKV